jgi:hypothetical protein
MPKPEYGAVRGSNDQTKAPIGNGFMPLARGASPITRNEGAGGDRKMGSYPLGGGASPINPPDRLGDRRGYSSDAEMPAAVEPGRGAVPVNPFLAGGGVARSESVADDAKARPGR